MIYNVMNIPRIIIHHGTILFMISFSALSAVNVILLSRSLSSKVIFTPEINRYRNSVQYGNTVLPGMFISTLAVD